MDLAIRLGNSLQVILLRDMSISALIVLTIDFLKKAATFIDEYVKQLDENGDPKPFVLFVTLVVSTQYVYAGSVCSTSDTAPLFCPLLHQMVWVGLLEKLPSFPSMSIAPDPVLIHL